MENSEYGSAWTIEGFKIAVVDDQSEWRARTVREIKLFIGDEAEVTEYISGIEFIKTDKQYDLVFLDIEMEGKDGLETAREYKAKYRSALIALLTTHTEYWKVGYAINVFRYLEKNHIREDIRETLMACQKIFEKRETIAISVPKYPDVNIRLENIIYVETEKRHVLIHTKQGVIISNESMGEIEEKLKGKGFMKSQRSIIVNFDEVKDYDDYMVIMKDGTKLDLSARKRKEFIDCYLRHKFENANS